MPFITHTDNERLDGNFKGRVIMPLERPLAYFEHVVNSTRTIHKFSIRSGDISTEDMTNKIPGCMQPGETPSQTLARLRLENNTLLKHLPRRAMVANERAGHSLNTVCEYGGGFNWMPVVSSIEPIAPLIDNRPDAWMVISQYNAYPFRSPPHGLYVKVVDGVEHLQVMNRYKVLGSPEVSEVLASVPLQRRQQGLNVEYKNAGGNVDGLVKVWLDGSKILDYVGRTGCHDNTYGSFYGFGAYGWAYAPATEKVDVWFENWYERVKQ